MRSARLTTAMLAGSVCLAALAPTAAAAAPGEPVAEVAPQRARPGESVTVTVACPESKKARQSITARSEAFVGGRAELRLLPRGGHGGKGPEYRGQARIAPEDRKTGGSRQPGEYGKGAYAPDSADAWDEPGELWDEEDSDALSRPDEAYGDAGYGTDDPYPSPSADGSWAGEEQDDDSWEQDAPWGQETGGTDPYGDRDHGDADRGTHYRVTGTCPDGSGFTTGVTVVRKPHGGADAGLGGSRRPAGTTTVAAGGALVAACVGLGIHLLRRRRAES
ncbi:hypothetical protein [Streptomyces sp. TR06-5]|uniref:hypothetical protein n=1 Tax=Streptomyces sp. TR06-5 TaxID=3385976 RepID=UPI0039A054E5